MASDDSDILAGLAETEGYVDPGVASELKGIVFEDAVKSWVPQCKQSFRSDEVPSTPEERVLATLDRALNTRCRNFANLSKNLPQLAQLRGDPGIEGKPETRKSPKQARMELQRTLQLTSNLYEDVRKAVVEGKGKVDCFPVAQRAEVVGFLGGSVRRAQEAGKPEEAEAFETMRSLLSRIATCTERGSASPSWLRSRGWNRKDLKREQELFLTVPEERTPAEAKELEG